MKTPFAVILASLSALALVTACASNPQNYPSVGNAPGAVNQGVQFGYVSRIDVVPVASHATGGAILGAVIGGVIGHQIGSGTGRDVATGVGAIGGAVIGHQIESRNLKDGEIYRISVRFDNGQVQQFDYQQINDLQPGDRVKLEGGQLYRL
ncbi:MAG: hypothetical protein ABT20_05240 [Rubrivivax sp. SCN 70-15]|nr:MAG: hypothetical protein ABT20_05240 [Rubrivivax sp. SCN 70-15]